MLSGQRDERLDALVDRSDRVRHVGHVPHDQLPGLYRAATGLIFPSLYEGFGLPPVEAMACGCPVAAADAGSLPEIVGDDGVLFDPLDLDAIASAMQTLWEGDGERRRSLRFSWRAAAERHVEIYRGVLA